MTAAVDSPSPALAAAAVHHEDLRARLTERSEAFIAAIDEPALRTSTRAGLIAFLRNELLPHAELEDDLLYTAARTPSTALLVRAMQDEHRVIGALVDEVGRADTAMDAVVAASALVVLCDVRIEQENKHLLPALEAAGFDLTELLGDHPQIVGHGPDREPTAAETRTRVMLSLT